MRILRLNKQDTAGIEERQAAERPPPLSGEAGPERAGDRDRLGFVRPCSAGPYIPFVWIQNKRSVPRLTMAEKLKIISLGGLNEIGKNMTVYEYGGDIIVIDVGMGFPDDDMYGIDVVIPDFSYLIKNKDRIRGIFLTHGHEDRLHSLSAAGYQRAHLRHPHDRGAGEAEAGGAPPAEQDQAHHLRGG